MNMTSGSLTVLSSLNIASDGSSLNASGGTIGIPVGTYSGTMSLTGATNFGGSMTSTGSMTIGGTQNWPFESTFTTSTGSATFQTDSGSAGAQPLAVQA